LQKIGSDRDVTDWGVEPHIKDFLFVLFNRNWHTPLQVTGNTLRL
jgi:hypothetical protein